MTFDQQTGILATAAITLDPSGPALRRLAALVGVTACAGAAAYLALLFRDTPALADFARRWGAVIALAMLAVVQALRSIKPWAAAGPLVLAVGAGLLYMTMAMPERPVAEFIGALVVGVLGILTVLAASGDTRQVRAASCRAVLRAHRRRADRAPAPELHAMAVIGLADWDLSTVALADDTDLNVTAVGGQVVIRVPAGCTWAVDQPPAGFWHQVREFSPTDAEGPTPRARGRSRARLPHLQLHILAIGASVHVIAPHPPRSRSSRNPVPEEREASAATA